VTEALASGCLATAFVWLQHQGVARAVAAARAEVRAAWLERLRSGACRAAVAQTGVRPGPASLRARVVPGGYVLDGEAPWVTGWGFVDVVHCAARTSDDTVVWALVDAVAGPTMTVRPLELVAVTASRTVTLSFTAHPVPGERVTAVAPLAEWSARDAAGLGLNGALSLGLTDRCLRLLADAGADGVAVAAGLRDELDARRAELDMADPAELPAVRAAATELALRAGAALAVAAGSRGILAGEHAQRLVREATFLLVFGSRPAIRRRLLGLVASPPALTRSPDDQ
jgi:hypothetical protein